MSSDYLCLYCLLSISCGSWLSLFRSLKLFSGQAQVEEQKRKWQKGSDLLKSSHENSFRRCFHVILKRLAAAKFLDYFLQYKYWPAVVKQSKVCVVECVIWCYINKKMHWTEWILRQDPSRFMPPVVRTNELCNFPPWCLIFSNLFTSPLIYYFSCFQSIVFSQ